MPYLLWVLYFAPAILVELACALTNWFVAFFITSEVRTDVVKRLDKHTVTLMRDYLVPPFYLWQTHDNAVDEWWYGLYNVDHFKFAQNWTQSDYTNSRWIRYYCRVCWLYRNIAYGWHYKLFSRPKESNPTIREYGTEGIGFWYKLQSYPSSFQLEVHIPLGSRYSTVNIGWKPHKGVDRLLYANRIPFVSFRKYKES